VSDQSSDIGRGLFGYRRSSVNQAISDRDIMLRQSDNRAREAEARAAEMEERMATLQREVTEQQVRMSERERELTEQMSTFTQRMHELSGQVAARDQEMAARDQHIVELRAHIERLIQQQLEAPPRPDGPPASATLSEEVARLLRAAEESADRIVEQARAAAAHHAAESEKQWRELQGSLARFAGWRDRVEPQLVDLYSRTEDLRLRITEIPDRVRAAFAPLAEASAATEAGLLALSEDLHPPLMVAPTQSGGHPDADDHDGEETATLRDDEPDAHSSAQ
jgi:predicted  nucleic acid-binding Zn-ribbon protein